MSVPPDKPAAPRPSRAERRHLFLEHACRLFAAQGYAATTPAQVAASARAREATLARHFPAKGDLWRGLLTDLLAATLYAWREETADLLDPLARLHALADRFVLATRTHAVAVKAVTRALAEGDDEEVLGGLRAFALEWEDFLAGLIAGGQQAGFFRRSLDPRVGAWQLLNAALGYAITLPLSIPLHERDGHASQAIECAFHCLLKTDV